MRGRNDHTQGDTPESWTHSMGATPDTVEYDAHAVVDENHPLIV